MPEPTTARRCWHCDGFPVVAITTGDRDFDGTRTTILATYPACPACPACHGTGTAPSAKPASAPVLAGVWSA